MAFLTGWPSIVAVILNYVKQSEVRGTWLDSHFGWQIRTFRYALLWLLLGGVAFVTFVGIPAAVAVRIATGFWVLYRVRKPIPVIMVTAMSAREDVMRAPAADASGYITKPFKLDVLMKGIKAVLGIG